MSFCTRSTQDKSLNLLARQEARRSSSHLHETLTGCGAVLGPRPRRLAPACGRSGSHLSWNRAGTVWIWPDDLREDRVPVRRHRVGSGRMGVPGVAPVPMLQGLQARRREPSQRVTSRAVLTAGEFAFSRAHDQGIPACSTWRLDLRVAHPTRRGCRSRTACPRPSTGTGRPSPALRPTPNQQRVHKRPTCRTICLQQTAALLSVSPVFCPAGRRC